MLPTSKKLVVLLLIIYTGLLSSGCGSQEPIKVGYAGELTGKRADMGVDGRNGALLAIEDINAQGGIDGRRLELIIENDKGEPETAQQVDEKLVNEGVVAIIGHMTSSQTATVLEQMNEAKTVLLSPISTSAQFSDKKDYLFRVGVDANAQGAAMAIHAYQTMELREVSGIYDVGNRVFTQSLWQAFVTKFEELGGEVVGEFTFISNETDLSQFTQEVLDTNPPALVFVSTAIDTALIIQYINQQEDKNPALLSSTWAQTHELLAKGGQAVEGLILNSMYNPDNPNAAFQEFSQKFEERFGQKPQFAAAHSYEAIQVLAEALKQTGGEAEGLPDALTAIKEFSAIQGNITLNEYGDVERDVYMMVVENGQYKLVETVSSN